MAALQQVTEFGLNRGMKKPMTNISQRLSGNWRRGPESAIFRRVCTHKMSDFQKGPSIICHYSSTTYFDSFGVRFGVRPDRSSCCWSRKPRIDELRFTNVNIGELRAQLSRSWRRKLARLLDPDEMTEGDFWKIMGETHCCLEGGMDLDQALQESMAAVTAAHGEWQAEF